MAISQNTYAERHPRGYPGQPANMTNWDADTRNVETSAGIGFGLACGQGAKDKGVVLGGALATFVGVSVRDVTVLNSASADKYPLNQNMAVLNEGDIFVSPETAVLVTDPVHYDASTGKFKVSGGEGPIVGARWMNAADADGIAVLRLSGHLPVP